MIANAIRSGHKLSPAAKAYALKNASVDELTKLDPSEGVYREILSREEASDAQVAAALSGLTKITKANPTVTLMDLIDHASSEGGNVSALGKVLARQPAAELAKVLDRIEQFAVHGATSEIKQLGYAAWVVAASPGDAFLAASKSKASLRDFLTAVPSVDQAARAKLYGKVEPLISALPTHLQAESSSLDVSEQGMTVEYYDVSPRDVSIETLDKLTPAEVGIVPDVSMDVPQRKKEEAFALRFTGMLHVAKQGRYQFRVESDDGSRVYVDGRLLIDNDGAHGMTEKRSRGIRLNPGLHEYVVTYSNQTGSKGLSSGWKGPGFDWQKVPSEKLSIRGGESLHDVAIQALSAIPGNETRKFSALSALVATSRSRPAAIEALSKIAAENWPQKEIRPLVDNLIGYLSEIPPRLRTGDVAMNSIALAKSLSTKLPARVAQSVEQRLQNLDVRVIAIGTVPTRMIFDKEMIVVQAGKPVEFRFSNTDHMPHNFAIVTPGSLEEVGELAEATGRDADAMARHYIPKSDRVLVSSKLLQPGESQAIAYDVPAAPGVYPYVCTYPGHWRRMHGALYIVKDLGQYQLNPEAYLAANPPEIRDELLQLNTRGQAWNYDDLIASMQPHLPEGRSFEVGKELFKVASCTGCHQINGEGRVFGPDLTKLDSKKQNIEHLLRSMVEPSKDIDETYQSYTFILDSGKTITGMVTQEDADSVHVVIDPLAKDAATIVSKDEIEERVKSDVSMMPSGLLDRLSREEILDLMAYVFAKGEAKHKLFAEQHDHQQH